MTSLFLTIALWGYYVLAPLGGAEPVVASVKSAPVTRTYQTYQVIKTERVVPKDHPPIRVEVGVLINYGDCVSPRFCVKRVCVVDHWGNWHWHCLDRRACWQRCGVQ